MRASLFFVVVVPAFAFAPAISIAAELAQSDVIQDSCQCGSKIDVSPSVTARFSPTYTFPQIGQPTDVHRGRNPGSARREVFGGLCLH